MTSSNGLICFTNCLLPQEDGSLVQKDLWVDERRGIILDAQVTIYEGHLLLLILLILSPLK
jgi:N-acetylglucosamine-6-phosphate deacetylase